MSARSICVTPDRQTVGDLRVMRADLEALIDGGLATGEQRLAYVALGDWLRENEEVICPR